MQRNIGKYIQKLRIDAGMSQEEMAVKIKKSKSLVSFIESKGQVNDNTLKNIAKVLNVAFETLKVYPYIDYENTSNDIETLQNKISDQEKQIELLKKVIDSQEKVIKLLESKAK